MLVSAGAGSGAEGGPTPSSQRGFKMRREVPGGGQQLTVLALEVHANSRGGLLPDPRYVLRMFASIHCACSCLGNARLVATNSRSRPAGQTHTIRGCKPGSTHPPLAPFNTLHVHPKLLFNACQQSPAWQAWQL